jgi:hypothetical protein
MKHEDGIEVYLKPRRKGISALRCPEYIIPDDDPMRRRCCIPMIEEDCTPVIRFSKRFDMFTANSWRYGCGYNSPVHGWSPQHSGARKSLVAGQSYVKWDLWNSKTQQILVAHRGEAFDVSLHTNNADQIHKTRLFDL